jgi:hypothetical protein
MTRCHYRRTAVLLTLVTVLLRPSGAAADAPAVLPEVLGLLQSNLAGVSGAELDAAAVRGLVQQFAPRVALVTNVPADGADADVTAAITRTNCFENAFGYLRIARVEPGLARALGEALTGLSTNRLEGLVLDLRYASGWDYAQVAPAADWFLADERPLVDWGAGVRKSTARTNAFTQPVVVLMNGRTAGAAEALAAALRETRAGLLIGTRTAGEASVFKEFPLSNGERLRVATAPVLVGDAQPVPVAGLRPDIQVTVPPDEEWEFFTNAFRVVRNPAAPDSPLNLPGFTNRPQNEAELVRLHREGLDPEADPPRTSPKPTLPKRPVVTDPPLARALDLLKALAVVRHDRP